MTMFTHNQHPVRGHRLDSWDLGVSRPVPPDGPQQAPTVDQIKADIATVVARIENLETQAPPARYAHFAGREMSADHRESELAIEQAELGRLNARLAAALNRQFDAMRHEAPPAS